MDELEPLFIITWLGDSIQVQIRYPMGLIPTFAQITFAYGEEQPLPPEAYTYGTALRIGLASKFPSKEEIQFLNSTYRDIIPYTYDPPSQGGDGIITFVVGKEDTYLDTHTGQYEDWKKIVTPGYTCSLSSNFSIVTWKYSNVLHTGGIGDKGAPTIISVAPSCDGIVTDFLAYSQTLLVSAYQYVTRGTEWGWVTFDTPQYAGQARGMATNPKESNVIIRMRDTLGDIYEFDIGYKAIPKSKFLWATNWLYGYGGNFYG